MVYVLLLQLDPHILLDVPARARISLVQRKQILSSDAHLIIKGVQRFMFYPCNASLEWLVIAVLHSMEGANLLGEVSTGDLHHPPSALFMPIEENSRAAVEICSTLQPRDAHNPTNQQPLPGIFRCCCDFSLASATA